MDTTMKDTIIAMYNDGHSLAEIAGVVGKDKSYISKVARAAGCTPRITRTSNKKTSKHRCPKCKHAYKKGANYCSNCGTDVRSAEQLLITDLEWLRGKLFLVPNKEVKAKADEITIEILKYLRSKM